MFDPQKILIDGPVCSSEHRMLEVVLSTPWTWPHSKELQGYAHRLGLKQPDPPQPDPGETLLVAVHLQEKTASLYRLTEQQKSVERAVVTTLVEDALECLQWAKWLARRDLPVLPKSCEAEPQLKAILIYTEGKAREEYLRGRSFGLPLCLAVASRLLAVPLFSSLCATGEVDADGHVVRVDGITEKVSLVARIALGVTKMLVPQENVEEARAAAVSRPDLEIVGVATLSDALRHGFPELSTYEDRWWGTESRRQQAAEEFFWLTLRGSPLFVEWDAVGRACDGIARRAENRDVQMQASTAAAIAWRHAGRCNTVIPWPDDQWLEKFRKPVRLELLAHIVQSAADAGDPNTERIAQDALRFVAPYGEEYAEDLKLLGAIGRAFAAAGKYTEAVCLLTRALKGWFDLNYVASASHCLCELLRVLGIQRKKDHVWALVHNDTRRVMEALEQNKDFGNLIFPLASAVRALVQTGEAKRALELTKEWNRQAHVGPAHAKVALFRWIARALAMVGEPDEARALRIQLQKIYGNNENVRADLLLVTLDSTLDAGGDPSPVLDELATLDPSFRFLERAGQSTAERATLYAEHSRY